MYEYPKPLVDYLTEQESEGSEIFTTQGEDSTIWFIVPEGLTDWYVILEWYEGETTYNQVNMCGKALNRFIKILKEQENKVK